MSTTATTQEVRHILSDYTIHLTGSNSEAPLPQEESNTISSVQNPPNWPTDRRRIPNFRPIDRDRTQEERPNGTSLPEQAFLTIMFTGVVTNATIAKVWGATGGPLFPGLFRYAIGGEW